MGYYEELQNKVRRGMAALPKKGLSHTWDRRKAKKTSPEGIVSDLMVIENQIRSILRIHGVPKETRIAISMIGAGVSGGATFEDIPNNYTDPGFTRPVIMIDKSIYEHCDVKEMVDTYCGVGLHEAAHVKHTRRNFVRQKKGFLSGERSLFEGLLEDERIEETIRQESPGFYGYIMIVKRTLFEKAEYGNTDFNELPDLDKMKHIAFGILRCPHLLKEEHKSFTLLDDSSPFDDIRGLLPHIPKTEKEVEKMGGDLISYFQSKEKYYEKEIKNPSDPSDTERNERLEKQREANERDEQLNKKGEELLKAAQKVANAGAGNFGTAQSITEAQKNEAKSRQLDEVDETLEALKEKLEELTEERENRFGSLEIQKMTQRADGGINPLSAEESKVLAKNLDEKLEYGGSWNSAAPKPGDDSPTSMRTIVIQPRITEDGKKRYNLAKSQIKGHIQRMKNVFKLRLGVQTVTSREKVEGRLDRTRIGRAMTTERIFKTAYKQVDQGIAVCLLLDESGSMGTADFNQIMESVGVYHPYSTKAVSTLKSSILIAEALKGVKGIELEIYSHTSLRSKSSGDDILIKHLYGKKTSGELERIAEFIRGKNNYDYAAIEEVAQRFVADTENENRLMIVLSDGAPCGPGNPVDATKKAVEKWRHKGLHIMGIAIDSYRVEDIYGKHTLKFTDMNSLVNSMRNLLTKIVRETSKIKVKL